MQKQKIAGAVSYSIDRAKPENEGFVRCSI